MPAYAIFNPQSDLGIFPANSFGSLASVSAATATIGKALTAAANEGGGKVWLPPGTIVVDYLTIPADNIRIVGSGAGATILQKVVNGTNLPLISAFNASWCGVEDITLDGQGPSQSLWTPNPYDADEAYPNNCRSNIHFTYGSNNTFRNVYNINAGRSGIQVTASPYAIIDQCFGTLNGFGSVCIEAMSNENPTPSISSGYSRVTGGGGYNDYCDSIRVTECDYVTIDGWHGIGAGSAGSFGAPDGYAGIYPNNCTQCIIINNYCTLNSNRGIDGGYGGFRNIYRGNHCWNHAHGGILTDNTDGTYTENHCFDNGDFGGICIQGIGHQIGFNRAYKTSGNQTYGLQLNVGSTTSNIRIYNNILTPNDTGAIDTALSSVSGYEAANNTLA